MKKDRLTEDEVRATCLEVRNWGRWGPDDQRGTMNFVDPAAVAAAARLVRRGAVFTLALPFDARGPQTGRNGRHNPIHFMMRSGVDAYSGVQDEDGLRYADDAIMMPLQSGTQWDALSHVFYDDYMYNGYDIRLVDSGGARRCGVEHVSDGGVGRGVLIDVPRWKGVESLEDGVPITADDLDEVLKHQKVEVGRGDFVLVRTGQLERCLKQGSWGSYTGGDAPGLAFDTVHWLHHHEVAAVATDTYGAEVRPEATEKIRRPWHWAVIPNMGLTVGEIFDLSSLAEDCAADGVYEFMFVGAPLPFTGAVGSPVNPLAIK